MCHGIVKYFNDRKGYGFIDGQGCDRAIYVHYTAIKADGYRSLSEGEEVAFDLAYSDRYPRALNVIPDSPV